MWSVWAGDDSLHLLTSELGGHLFRKYLMAGDRPLPDPMLSILNWAFMNKLNWNFRQNAKRLMHETTFVKYLLQNFVNIVALWQHHRIHMLLNPSPLVPHICVSQSGYSAPSHYLNQCLVMVNWTLRNKLQWKFNHYPKMFVHENTYEIIVCEMVGILSRGSD